MYQFLGECHGCRCRVSRTFTLLPLDEIEEIRKQFEAAPTNGWHKNLSTRSGHACTWRKEALPKKRSTSPSSFAENMQSFLSKNQTWTSAGANYQVKVDDNLNIVEISW